MMNHLSPAQQAEGIINRLEYAKTAFSDDERNLIVNYAYKLNDMERQGSLRNISIMRKRKAIREQPLRSLMHRQRLMHFPTL